MKRYAQLTCDTCRRTRHRLLDPTRYAPDLCDITLGCTGRLSPTGYSSSGSTSIGPAPTGLTNWYPRGTDPSAFATETPEAAVDVTTGAVGQVVLAVADGASPPSGDAVVRLRLRARAQTAASFRQYVYRRAGGYVILNGVEDGLARKVLRYDAAPPTPDQVDVYVDGVPRERGPGPDQFRLYEGVAGDVPPNSIRFGSPVTGAAPQVDVVVRPPVAEETVTLTFARALDDESRPAGAWEGVAAALPLSAAGARERWTLFVLDLDEVSGALPLDVALTPLDLTLDDPAGPPPQAVALGRAALLVSRTGLTTELDRLRAVWAPLSGLTAGPGAAVRQGATRRIIEVPEAAVAPVFPPLDVERFAPAAPLRTGLAGDAGAAQVDNPLITGPDQ